MGDPQFIIAQVFGILGMVAMLVSFQLNRKTKLLWMQILSCIFYIGQYLCLGAFSGCLMNFLAMVRNFCFSRFERVPKYLIGLFIIAAIISLAFVYDQPLSLLPCFATIIYTIGLSSKKMLHVRLADLISCGLYLIYNLNVGAYTGTIATVLEATSTFIALWRFDFGKSTTSTKKLSPKPLKPQN